ncbi:MAG: ankyrin repeat domain-containing protein [Syntrophorhabdaceae bacterium]|nr:ankyrin repeat domain-containing protein [Syntrophorhabdaceae bacterium]
MSVKSTLAKLIKIFGFVYFLLSCIICVVMCVFAIRAMMKTGMSPGFVVFILPLIGIFSGYWIWTARYGWWRMSIIAVSLLLTLAIAFTAIFIAPKMGKHSHNKLESHETVKTVDTEVQTLFSALYANNMETVRQQLEKGVNVNAKNDVGETPLHITQNKAIVKMLLLKGADVNSVDANNMTPIFNKEVEISKILVEAGADIHVKSKKGNTPLIWYSYSGYIEGIQYLVSIGASLNTTNSDGHTAYDIAETFGHRKLLAYLKSIGAKSGKKTKGDILHEKGPT